MSMNGKVALITGASSGIGSACAYEFAVAGAKVVLAARRENELQNICDGIKSKGGEATYIVTDVSNSSDVKSMVDYAIEQFGRLDFAVNNAGIEGNVLPITEMSDDAWAQVIDINLKGTFFCIKHEARAMLAAGNGGAIVNIGSVNSFLGFAGGAAYATSKHGLLGLSSSVSAELAAQNIRVNMVCPGIVKTPMHNRIRATVGDAIFDEMILPKVHMQRAGEPEEIAKTILFLCSDSASYITGTSITPDGGMVSTI